MNWSKIKCFLLFRKSKFNFSQVFFSSGWAKFQSFIDFVFKEGCLFLNQWTFIYSFIPNMTLLCNLLYAKRLIKRVRYFELLLYNDYLIIFSILTIKLQHSYGNARFRSHFALRKFQVNLRLDFLVRYWVSRLYKFIRTVIFAKIFLFSKYVYLV